jgi:hypothetical protein
MPTKQKEPKDRTKRQNSEGKSYKKVREHKIKNGEEPTFSG